MVSVLSGVFQQHFADEAHLSGAAVGCKTASELEYLLHTEDKEELSEASCLSRSTLTLLSRDRTPNTPAHYTKYQGKA